MRETKTVNNYSGEIGFSGLLTIIFIVLKLCKVINWSWIWVLSPIWIGFAALILFVIVGTIIVMTSSNR
jgi:hypothetical protein